tara:strand:+ start:71 stop:1258 length:1188 start_codon:yes stop_codon:yes gene_type:complete
MGPYSLNFDYRDLFLSPRLGLSGKKIWVFVRGNILGFASYWILTYAALAVEGHDLMTLVESHGLYPFLRGTKMQWYSRVIYWMGITAWLGIILLSSTAVSRITLKQIKGNDFFSGKDGWRYSKRHISSILLTPLALLSIITFFVLFASLIGLISSIPFLGKILFVVPYVLYFFGSVFTIFTAFVFLVSMLFTPSIVGVYEEDTIGAVFNSYSITLGQAWRLVLYHLILLPLAFFSVEVMSWFWMNGMGFINFVFGSDWLLGNDLYLLSSFASSIVFTPIIETVSTIKEEVTSFIGLSYSLPKVFPYVFESSPTRMSSVQTIFSLLLAVSYFIIGLSILSFGFSILSVGHTIMLIIFKKKGEDDNLLTRVDEDEIEDDYTPNFEPTEDNTENSGIS